MRHTNEPEGGNVIHILGSFILANREEIAAQALRRAIIREQPGQVDPELVNDFTTFLDDLANALGVAEHGKDFDHSLVGKSAAKHGHELLLRGSPLAQVVHSYGDVCQAIADVAIDQDAWIPAESFRALHRCLDNALAEAVTSYAQHRERAIKAQGIEKLGILAHEMRNLLGLATLSFESIKSSTALDANDHRSEAVCARSLMGLSALIDRSLADVRLESGHERREKILVTDLLTEVEADARVYATDRKLNFKLQALDSPLRIEGDRQILVAALRNLLHNAFKFTPRGRCVSLTTLVAEQRVRFEVEDECGGLAPGTVDDLFRPFKQHNHNQSGVGLGLVICQKAAHANHGEIFVRDLPGKGCVFTLELPLSS